VVQPEPEDVRELVDHLVDAAEKGKFGLIGEPLAQPPDPPPDSIEITCVAGEKDGHKGVFLAFSTSISYIAWTAAEARDLAERLCIEAEKVDGVEAHVRTMRMEKRPIHGHTAAEKARIMRAGDKRQRRRGRRGGGSS
jgi:hypothetical protein